MGHSVLANDRAAVIPGNDFAAVPPVPFEVGESYFFRTVTYHNVGRVKEIVGKFLVLEQASWIGDSGRFTQAIDDGVLSEIEPVKAPVYLNVDSIVDAFLWKHKLPSQQK